jgi:hypothetical protein
MSLNRLYLYDPETNTAAMIARGYSVGWSDHGTTDHINEFFDGVDEYTGEGTRLKLRTELNLPADCKTFYQEDPGK